MENIHRGYTLILVSICLAILFLCAASDDPSSRNPVHSRKSNIRQSVRGHRSTFGHHFYLPEVSEHKAKSFLHKKQATLNPAYCLELRYERWCELNIAYCQGQHEHTREQLCATLAPCVPGQHCLLTTPCPAHFRSACVDIDECAINPCQNGGTCHNGNNLYTCTCLPGWRGHDCEIGEIYTQ
ncbi:delta-like protein D [Ostrea edulis]|uniref:delta-like protein D n=1 Tax=Ostrea edulis TaxID=37623 RepID=UPI0024AFED67|nr:delta-like protein D [Ostrea edulis]